MPTIAYIANQFPSPVEPYVMEEILELRGRGLMVVSCSARRPSNNIGQGEDETLFLEPIRIGPVVAALWLGLRRWKLLADLLKRVVFQGNESPGRRLRTLLHTWLGAYYALLLRDRGVEHIHVHHGYFASWVTLVAARLLGISFSMTLHGSDLLLHPYYLEAKLKYCKFCITISEFNRRHILEQYPECDPYKVLVQRLGVFPPERCRTNAENVSRDELIMLAVGRLHSVKDHHFLVHACRLLKDRGICFVCRIAGEGEERKALENLISSLDLQAEVRLLGHVPRPQLQACYEDSDLVVLTSRSEGIPVVLMEAMALGKIVLAPAITGIPELVRDGRTGFLYQPGSFEDFVAQVELIGKSLSALGPMRAAARQHVFEHFNREQNLAAFGEAFLKNIGGTMEIKPYENPVLQQI